VAPELVHAGRRVPLVPGRSLFDAADELEMVVPASCARSGRCRECVVEVRGGAAGLGPRTPEEAYLPERFRLACRALVGEAGEDVEFAVLRRRLRILMPPDSPPLPVDPAAREIDGRVRIGVGAGRPEDRDAQDLGPAGRHLVGLAVDVGTTTVVVELRDLRTGAALASGAFENPQRFGGSDVVHRISYEASYPGELRRALRRALNREIRRVAEGLGVERRSIVETVIVGNTTMRDLFFGLDVVPIGRSPFRSVTETALRAGLAASTVVERRAHELGVWMHPQGRVWGAPLIGSHIGADAAADLLATGFADAMDGSAPGTVPRMMIDVGTNTEVVATDGRRVLACSAPAGPAFEGGLVRWGMVGSDGAIESVHLGSGRPGLRVIGGVAPTGICGSGLVDLLSELRRVGAMRASGSFTDGSRAYSVVPALGIDLSRADASHLAQAKAANAVGVRVLLRRLGIGPRDLRRLDLAGGFASHLDVPNAQAIGFLPPMSVDRVVSHGNASVRGAAILLLDLGARGRLEHLVARIEHTALEAERDFFDLFVDGCAFEPLPEHAEVGA
jgi:uncharacterized 2Fe-2S/4Fe-4S cluster protein (DUF4445 family)